jgi:hypothetical protein
MVIKGTYMTGMKIKLMNKNGQFPHATALLTHAAPG